MKLKKIYIEITNRCNLQCSFCSESNKKKQEMAVNDFAHIIKQVKPYTNNVYLHVKGEPLLHSELSELLTICEANEMRVNITSNATLLKHVYQDLMRFSCIKKMNLSLHCEQTIPNYFNDVFACANHLSKQMHVIYRLWTLQDKQLDATSLTIVDKLVAAYDLDEQQKQVLLEENNVKIASQIYVDKDNEFQWPSESDEIQDSNGYCFALKTHMAILVDGSVVPCCLDGEGRITLGNIFKQEFSDILQSERLLKLKKSFQDRKPCEILCQKCSFKQRLKV